MSDWSKAAATLAICAVVAYGLLVTSNVNCLWGLVIIPVIYKAA